MRRPGSAPSSRLGSAGAQAGYLVVAADWSGAATAEQRRLWLAETDPGSGTVVSLAGMTRVQAGDRLLRLAESATAEVVAGLDFGFSLPAPVLDSFGIDAAFDLWADPDRLERWLADCPAPFWGRPGRRRPQLAPTAHWRQTELACAKRPGSVLQLGGAGAVGTASLRGMPVLHRLRAGGWHIWPFDPFVPPVAVEVWPRQAIGAVVKSDPAARREWLADRRHLFAPDCLEAAAGSEDAFDAAAAALGLLASLGRHAVSPANHQPIPPACGHADPWRDPIARREGWIWTVPTVGGNC